jgi:hypothetical protein
MLCMLAHGVSAVGCNMFPETGVGTLVFGQRALDTVIDSMDRRNISPESAICTEEMISLVGLLNAKWPLKGDPSKPSA